MFKYLKDLFFGTQEVEVKEAPKQLVQPSSKVKSDRIKQNQTPATKTVKKTVNPSINRATTKPIGSTNSKKK